MATRFYSLNTVAPVSPTADAGWEIASGFSRRTLEPKNNSSKFLENSDAESVPITTTQDILFIQLVSPPIAAQAISGTISLVVRCGTNATTSNTTLAVVAKIVSQDGGTSRGTLFSVFGTDTNFVTTSTTGATRIVNAQTLTQQTAQSGDRIVVEIGAHAAAPSTGPTTTAIFYGEVGSTDYALTSGLTTVLNSWVEFSQNIYPAMPNNYQFIKTGDGMSVSEKIR